MGTTGRFSATVLIGAQSHWARYIGEHHCFPQANKRTSHVATCLQLKPLKWYCTCIYWATCERQSSAPLRIMLHWSLLDPPDPSQVNGASARDGIIIFHWQGGSHSRVSASKLSQQENWQLGQPPWAYRRSSCLFVRLPLSQPVPPPHGHLLVAAIVLFPLDPCPSLEAL